MKHIQSMTCGDGPRDGSSSGIQEKAYMFSEDAEAEEREQLAHLTGSRLGC